MTIYFVADCETTGVKPTDRIIELAFVALDEEFNVLGQGQSLIDPLMPIPYGASAVNGITDPMVAAEPTIDEYMELAGWPLLAEDSVLIAHNAAFDMRYLKPYMDPNALAACSLRLARQIYPDTDSHKLMALKYYLGLPDGVGDPHRAGFDVEILVHLMKRMAADTGSSLADLVEWSLKPVKVTHWKFGKFKGQPIEAADKGYIKWLLQQDNVDPDLRATLEPMT